MSRLYRRYGPELTLICLGLTAFWMLVLVWVPCGIMIEQSFRPALPVHEVGGIKDAYTVRNYASLFNASVTKMLFGIELPLNVFLFLQTIFYSVIVTMLCFAFAYPLAWYIAKHASTRAVPVVLLLLMIPLCISEMLRTFALYVILAFQGPLNALVGAFGMKPVRWLTGFNGVIIGMIYTYVLFLFFPIYNSLTTLDDNQVDAARDLGAKWWQVHLWVVMPHAKPGIASGATMVFMFAVGSVLVPQLLGSPSSRWFTEVILRSMFESQDWNTAAAYAFMLLLACLVFVSIVMRVFRVNISDIAK